MLKTIRNIFNGLAFGITETIPGVSGGTIAIILGFYFELIETINHFTEDIKKSLRFLLPLVVGMVAGILIFSSIINYLLLHYSFPTMLFFIGLITGIIPHIFSKVKNPSQKLNAKDILLIAVPFLALITISFLKAIPVTEPAEAIASIDLPYMIFIFFAGIIAAAALIIPGISGSFVLLLLGIYPLVIHCLSKLGLLLADITNTALIVQIGKVLAPLVIGIIIGGLTMARLIEKLLKNYHRTIYSLILGLLSASVIVLLKTPIVYKSGISPLIIAAGIVTLLLGAVTSFNLGKKRL